MRCWQAHMLLLLGGTLLKEGDSKQAMELLGRAREAIPLQKYPHLIVISLVSYLFIQVS